MYGWLTKDDTGGTSLHTLDWDFGADPPQLSDEVRLARVKHAMAKLKQDWGPRANFSDAYAKLSQVITHARSDEDAQFALCMNVEFCRQNENDPMAAWKVIDQRIDLEFGPLPDKGGDPDIARVVKRLKAVALTMSPSHRDAITGFACAEVRRAIVMRRQGLPHEMNQHSIELKRVFAAVQRLKDPAIGKCAQMVVVNTLCASRSDTVKQMADALLAVLGNANMVRLFVVIQESTADLAQRDFPEKGPMLDSLQREVIYLAKDDLNAQPTAIMYRATAATFIEANVRMVDLWTATTDAVRRGVDFGPRTVCSREALETHQASFEARDERDLLALLAELEVRDATEAGGDESSELPPVARETALSQLVDWNEGPVFGAHRTSINPASVVQREPARRRRRTQPKANRPPQPKVVQPDAAQTDRIGELEAITAPGEDLVVLTEPIVNSVSIAGLEAAARFMFDELGDLIGLGKTAGADVHLLQQCVAVQTELGELARLAARAPRKFELGRAQEILSRAETNLFDLRHGIRIARTNSATQEKFRDALCSLLATERLSRGRRDGGQVACALLPEDWTWVNDSFHGRRVPGRRQFLWVDSLPVPLNDDEALGLYVTLCSNTPGIVFDISVHVFRRLNRGGPPLEPPSVKDPFPLLDPQEWFDTHRPCYVAHVPRGVPQAVKPGPRGKPPAKK
jgi:hypothetical protein